MNINKAGPRQLSNQGKAYEYIFETLRQPCLAVPLVSSATP